MIDIKVYSLAELLRMDVMQNNKTKLATVLRINRSTVKKYLKDENCEKHLVRCIHGKFSFYRVTQGTTT